MARDGGATSWREVTEAGSRRGVVVERARVWLVCRQRFDAAKHSADVQVLTPVWRALAAAEEQLAAAIEELDK